MAQVVFSYNFERIKKQLNVYERSQAKFAAKKTLTRLNKELKGKNGLVAKTYKKGNLSRRFRDPVSFTLNSTYGIQRGTELTVGVKDEKALKGKGNPASKYLYPVIGGGSTKAYGTQFTQYLRNKDLMKRSDYPQAVMDNRFIRKNKRLRVTKNTYRNTIIALENPKKHGSKGGKIQDARVVAFRDEKNGRPAGIYREVPKRKEGEFEFRALFFFYPTPTQRGKFTFTQRIREIADKRVFKYWVSETRKLARKQK